MIIVDLATPAIAAIIAFITVRQYLVSRDQLRYALFERRFDVYKRTQIFLGRITENSTTFEELLPDFYDASQRARFLFGKDVNKWLEEIRKHALAMNLAHLEMTEEEGGSEARKSKSRKKSEELKWLSDQLGELHHKFGVYMNFARH